MTPEIQARIYILRQKSIANTLTREEMIESVRLLAEGRRSAAAASITARTTRKAAASKPQIDADALLDDFMSGSM